jgi:hypothetical protein
MSEKPLSSPEKKNPTDRKSGRAAFDEAGRGIWEWQTATGIFERTVTDEQLKRLEAVDLKLEERDQAQQGRVWPSRSEVSKDQRNSTSASDKLHGAHVRNRSENQVTPFARLLKRIAGS